MPEPLAIYGATKISYDLVKEIYGYVEKWAKAVDSAKKIEARFKLTSIQLTVFLDFFKEKEAALEANLRDSILSATDKLRGTLRDITLRIKKHNPEHFWERARWPWIQKDLDEGEKALASWVSRIDVTFTKLPDDLKQAMGQKLLSAEYKQQMFPNLAFLEHLKMMKEKHVLGKASKDVLLSTMRSEPKDSADTTYWRDIIDVPQDILRNATKVTDLKVEVAKLAGVLKSAQPDITHIPKASGWFERLNPNKITIQLGIAYKVPPKVLKFDRNEEGTALENGTYTIKDMVQARIKHPLNRRLELAVQLSRAVAYVHGLHWVHKSLRSSNVLLVFEEGDKLPSQGGIGNVHLKGFTVARRSAARSTGPDAKNSAKWMIQVYVHPKRQLINLRDEEEAFYAKPQSTASEPNVTALSPQAATASPSRGRVADPPYEFFQYKHDIYSLGVMLLEIGLWEDLTPQHSTFETLKPDQRKEKMVNMAEDQLSLCMGQRYLNVVKACLNIDETEWEAQRVLDELLEIKL